MHPHMLKMIDDRKLVSAMNRTKWDRLAQAITVDSEFEPNVREKDLDEAEPSGFCLIDWTFSEFNPALIEWIDIDPIKRKRVGALVPDIETDVSTYILDALKNSNVPYSIEGGKYRVWGYYDPSDAPNFV